MKKLIKHYPITILLTIIIWILCLIPIEETPFDDFSWTDKLTHVLMFGPLTIAIWVEHVRQIDTSVLNVNLDLLLIIGFVAPILMGGLTELAQQYCTYGNRTGDLFDWLADCVGVSLGAIISMLVLKKKII